MSTRKARHLLMQAIVRGCSAYGTAPEYNHIFDELSELGRCNGLQPLNRQRLLQVIHATRALDTCLSTILKANGKTPEPGIGKMLHQMKTLPHNAIGYLDHPTATAFAKSIAHKRNTYAHTANAFPTSSQEADKIVSEVHACLAIVL